MILKCHQAEHGDFLTISTEPLGGQGGKPLNIFIDSGTAGTYTHAIRPELLRLAALGQSVDLWLISHNHDDHFGGAEQYIKDTTAPKIIKNWAYNQPINPTLPPPCHRIDIVTGKTITIGCITLSILTPTPQALTDKRTAAPIAYGIAAPTTNPTKKIPSPKPDYTKPLSKFNLKQFQEDDSTTNRTSITFIATDNTTGQSVLFLADAPTQDVITALQSRNYSQNAPLTVHALKVAHHASKHNTSQQLLQLINTEKYIISTNSQNQYFFPTKQALAHIIRQPSTLSGGLRGANLYHNYQTPTLQTIFTPEDTQQYTNFTQHFPNPNDTYIQIPL